MFYPGFFIKNSSSGRKPKLYKENILKKAPCLNKGSHRLPNVSQRKPGKRRILCSLMLNEHPVYQRIRFASVMPSQTLQLIKHCTSGILTLVLLLSTLTAVLYQLKSNTYIDSLLELP